MAQPLLGTSRSGNVRPYGPWGSRKEAGVPSAVPAEEARGYLGERSSTISDVTPSRFSSDFARGLGIELAAPGDKATPENGRTGFASARPAIGARYLTGRPHAPFLTERDDARAYDRPVSGFWLGVLALVTMALVLSARVHGEDEGLRYGDVQRPGDPRVKARAVE